MNPNIQAVLADIDAVIVANGNNEITGPVLNAILESMITQLDLLMGDLDYLQTNDKNTLVNAINELKSSIGSGNSVKKFEGADDPNVVNPTDSTSGDVYVRLDAFNNPYQLYMKIGTTWINLQSGSTPITQYYSPYTDPLGEEFEFAFVTEYVLSESNKNISVSGHIVEGGNPCLKILEGTFNDVDEEWEYTFSKAEIYDIGFYISSSSPNFHGARYSADFSDNFQDRSLVDKGYVDVKTIDVNSNTTIGITHSNKIIRITGTCTLTIPNNLDSKVKEFYIDVVSGTLTIALGGSVSQTGLYSLTLEAGEKTYCYRVSNNVYRFR